MRTKTLLLSAAVGAVGLLAADAQVYSVNSVGYVNKEVPTGFSLIANPLVGANNTVPTLFPSVPDGTIVYKFDSGTQGFVANNYFFGWSDANMTLVPGEGAFIYNPGAAFTVTFVGEVAQGALDTAVAAGFSILSSKVPQQGQLDTELGYPVADGDIVYRYDSGASAYVAYNYFFGWNQIPIINVGESFFAFNSGASKTWSRNFNVNN